ncbi:YcjF family protein [Vibrio ostreicida]|uniref:YcjF family protein n=1 Tax=Vibrio ostreicida TaxID=526588 RepID=UPI003B5C04A0
MKPVEPPSLKQKHIFTQNLRPDPIEAETLRKRVVSDKSPNAFSPAENEPVDAQDDLAIDLEPLIRPKLGRRWAGGIFLVSFSSLLAWQMIDRVITSYQLGDWLSLGWTGFMSVLASFGIGVLAKEMWKLKKLRRHFDWQQKSQALLVSDSVGQGKPFCERLAQHSGVQPHSHSYDRWLNMIQRSHSDAEIVELYDAIVVAEQDKVATKIISRYATESAALVAISPLAIVDMLLVAWRTFKMIDSVADVYGMELGYWSRLKLFKATLINMAAAGASELAIDASMDLMSMDLAGKVSARVGQGIGVGILTARLGLKSMALLRPTPWHQERSVKLGTIRKQIVEKIASLTIK